MALVNEVAVVSLRGRVVLLGDDWLAAPQIQVFSEEGSLLSCLPSATFTPGSIKHGIYVMRDGRVYAVGYKEWEGKWKLRVEEFDGWRWSFTHEK